MRFNSDHVKVRAEGGVTFCERCGAEYVPTFPLPVHDWAAQMRDFIREHLRCSKADVRC